MAQLLPSQLLFDLLEHFEGMRLTAYQDQAGVWTIGYGTTYYPNQDRVHEGETCTKEGAQACLVNALMHFIEHLNATIPTTLTQGQFDALCDFIYNLGQGAWDSSTLRKTVNNTPEYYMTIQSNFEAWHKMHIDGKLVDSPGLLRRRKCEAFLYQNGFNHATFFEGVV